MEPGATELTDVAAEDAIGGPPPFSLPEPGAKLTFQLHCDRLPPGRWLDVLCAEIPRPGRSWWTSAT